MKTRGRDSFMDYSCVEANDVLAMDADTLLPKNIKCEETSTGKDGETLPLELPVIQGLIIEEVEVEQEIPLLKNIKCESAGCACRPELAFLQKTVQGQQLHIDNLINQLQNQNQQIQDLSKVVFTLIGGNSPVAETSSGKASANEDGPMSAAKSTVFSTPSPESTNPSSASAKDKASAVRASKTGSHLGLAAVSKKPAQKSTPNPRYSQNVDGNKAAPLSCKICLRTFTRKHNLQRHVRSVHDKKRDHC